MHRALVLPGGHGIVSEEVLSCAVAYCLCLVGRLVVEVAQGS